MCEILEDTVLGDHQKRCIDSMRRCTDMLLILVNDVLDCSKVCLTDCVERENHCACFIDMVKSECCSTRRAVRLWRSLKSPLT
jgi:hypothetical protein